ncbi:hypothetical protein KUCAC02_025862, partial [Chaenocephalus aceratus]
PSPSTLYPVPTTNPKPPLLASRQGAAQTMRVPGRTGNAWPLEQVFMEIISGNPNVNKRVTDLGMGEDGKTRRGV